MRIAALAFGLVLALSVPVAPVHAQQNTAGDDTYTVQDGDTLYSIAQKVGVSVRTLMRWNDLEDSSIQVGQTLRVRPPEASAAASESTVPPASAEASPHGRYTVEAGDTFVGLALRLGTTADTLFAMNDSTTAPLAPDRPLQLPRRFGPPTHTVAEGQTLYSIAGTYGVSVRSLKATNNLSSDTLQPGQRLQIPRRAGVEMPPPGQWAPPDTTGPVARYPEAFAGRLTASGTAYNPDALVVSHPSLPFDSVVLLSATDPTRHTFARVIDRGPVEDGMLLDISDAVAEQLGLDADGPPSSVALRVVWAAE